MTESRHHPSLREQLDAVRPDSDDLADPEFHAAAAAVESSDAWRETFEVQQQFDRHLADALQDVDLPEGAGGRLLQKLAEARTETARTGRARHLPSRNTCRNDALPPGSAGASPSANGSSQSATEAVTENVERYRRRRWGYLVTAAASVAVCIALGILLRTGAPQTLTLDELRGNVPLDADNHIDVSELERFDGFFPFTLPSGRWERVHFDDAYGLDFSHDGRHDAALFPFVAGNRRPVSGYLLIVPASSVSPPPAHSFLSTAGISYFPVENTAWTSTTGELVYVCFVEPGNVSRLSRMLYPGEA